MTRPITEFGANELSSAIILQAMEDWAILCKKRRNGERYPVIQNGELVVHFRELQRFFHDDMRIFLGDKEELYDAVLKRIYSIPGCPKSYMGKPTVVEGEPAAEWKPGRVTATGIIKR